MSHPSALSNRGGKGRKGEVRPNKDAMKTVSPTTISAKNKKKAQRTSNDYYNLRIDSIKKEGGGGREKRRKRETASSSLFSLGNAPGAKKEEKKEGSGTNPFAQTVRSFEKKQGGKRDRKKGPKRGGGRVRRGGTL